MQLNQNQGDKGPDSQAEMFRQMLAQHMVRKLNSCFKRRILFFISFLIFFFLDVDERYRRTDGYDWSRWTGRFVLLLQLFSIIINRMKIKGPPGSEGAKGESGEQGEIVSVRIEMIHFSI